MSNQDIVLLVHLVYIRKDIVSVTDFLNNISHNHLLIRTLYGCDCQSIAIMNLDTSEHPTFHVDQSGQCNSVDDPDFPSRCDTDGMIADLIAGMNQIKWGENKKKAFMNAEHVRHLVGCLQGKPGFTWKDPQEKHTTRRDYRVVSQ